MAGIYDKSRTTTDTNAMQVENPNMPKPDRKALVLQYFADNEVMLPTGLAHKNLREYRNVTFSSKTTQRMLFELVDDGLMEKVDRGGHPLYRISDEGKELLDKTNHNSVKL